MAPYALTILLAALLLFAVQPMLGKVLLPWFGGSATVWTTCLMFFQCGLLAGYAYAHAVCRWLSPSRQAALHVGLLAVSLAFLPILPDAETWKPAATTWPTGWIVLLLAVNAGLPFVLLSATTPLVTRWFSQARPTASPYRLYAISNAGSLLGLAAYPFVIEPMWPVQDQAHLWAGCYVAFFACAIGCALSASRAGSRLPRESEGVRQEPDLRDSTLARRASEGGAAHGLATSGTHSLALRANVGESGAPSLALRASVVERRDLWLWLALSACGSVMLVATTSQLCQEVAVVPFLWVLPLAVYLTTFIVAFSGPAAYHRRLWMFALAALMLPTCALLYAGPQTPFWLQIAGYTLTLLTVGMTCHGELARLQPPARHLTLYYLCIAGGGALGGAFVALVAPLIFPGYWEYDLGLFAACVLVAVAAHRSGAWNIRRQPGLRQALGIGLVSLAVVLAGEMYYGRLGAIESVRNFYGVIRVIEDTKELGPFRRMVHGRIDHGRQYLDAEKRHWPTLYFGRESGIDLAIRLHPRREAARPDDRALRIGVIGLGTGTIAAHGQAGDVIRYYEINPAVEVLCRRYFTFLEDSAATTQIELGDARLTLERELADAGSQQFDVLAVDAFRNDAIPVHLLTEECAEIYFAHLQEDALLALHLSNNVLDLTGVARGLAECFNRTAIRIVAGDDPQRGAKAGVWVILTNNQRFLDPVADRVSPWTADDPPPMRWTDNYAPLLSVLK